MSIVVIGSGLIGLSTAYFLAKEGFEVTVIDKNSEPGLGTSFANGGQISVCYSEPWASISNLKKMISWIGKEDSPILFKPDFSYDQFIWGTKFLWECLPFNNRQNIKKLIGLSLFSRNTLQEMRLELGNKLSYNQSTSGILTVYSSEKDFIKGQQDAKFMSQFGCNRIIKNAQETLEIAPSLLNASQKIYGSDYSPEDESGDAHLFCIELFNVCKSMGVKFIFNHEVFNLNSYEDEFIDDISVAPIINGQKDLKNAFLIKAQLFVVAAASYSKNLLNIIGYNLPIYPVKGYSATLNILDNSLVSDVSITDSSHKMVFTKIGDKLRIAGTAEFNGFNYEHNEARSNALINRAKQLYHPNALDFNSPVFWNGLRPTTPSSFPIMRSYHQNVFVNAGHGTLGFTMAAGSGKIMANNIKSYFSP